MSAIQNNVNIWLYISNGDAAPSSHSPLAGGLFHSFVVRWPGRTLARSVRPCRPKAAPPRPALATRPTSAFCSRAERRSRSGCACEDRCPAWRSRLNISGMSGKQFRVGEACNLLYYIKFDFFIFLLSLLLLFFSIWICVVHHGDHVRIKIIIIIIATIFICTEMILLQCTFRKISL